MQGYVFIFALFILGEFFTKQVGINIPGSIVAMLVLFTFFYFTKKVENSIEKSSKTLLKYLPLFLVPIGVGIKELFVTFDSKLLAMLAASILSLIIAVVITVFTIWIVKSFLTKVGKKEILDNNTSLEKINDR